MRFNVNRQRNSRNSVVIYNVRVITTKALSLSLSPFPWILSLVTFSLFLIEKFPPHLRLTARRKSMEFFRTLWYKTGFVYKLPIHEWSSERTWSCCCKNRPTTGYDQSTTKHVDVLFYFIHEITDFSSLLHCRRSLDRVLRGLFIYLLFSIFHHFSPHTRRCYPVEC